MTHEDALSDLREMEERITHMRYCVDKALKALEDDESKNDYVIGFLYEALDRERPSKHCKGL